MKHSAGFTVVELLVALVFLGLVAGVAYSQYQALEIVHRDQDRKVAINAIHYNLEEVVRPTLGGYPRVLAVNQLRAMDPNLLVDPQGNRLGEPGSDYRYEPTGCNGGDLCAGYTLRTSLERETDFVRKNPQAH